MPLHALVFVLDGLLMGAEDYAFIRTWTVTGSVLGAVMAQVGVSLGAGLLWLWISYEVVMLLRGLPMLVRARGDAWLPGERHRGRPSRPDLTVGLGIGSAPVRSWSGPGVAQPGGRRRLDR